MYGQKKELNWDWLDAKDPIEVKFINLCDRLGDPHCVTKPSIGLAQGDTRFEALKNIIELGTLQQGYATALCLNLVQRYVPKFHWQTYSQGGRINDDYEAQFTSFGVGLVLTFSIEHESKTWTILDATGRVAIAVCSPDETKINHVDLFCQIIATALSNNAFQAVDCQLSASFVDLALGNNRT